MSNENFLTLVDLAKTNATPLIATSFSDAIHEDLIRAICAEKLDIAELRLDHYQDLNINHVLAVVQQFSVLPTILTIRSHAEGSPVDIPDATRLELFASTIAEVSCIDIEQSSGAIRDEVIALARMHQKAVIVSYHNFQETPTNSQLEQQVAQAWQSGADIVKIAVTLQSPQDVVRLTQFALNHYSERMILIGMGDAGLMSRVFFPALGSLLTFAYWGQSSAPGQIHFSEMVDLLSQFYPAFAQKRMQS